MAKIKFTAVRSGTLLAPIDEDGENARLCRAISPTI